MIYVLERGDSSQKKKKKKTTARYKLSKDDLKEKAV
jgi:hypothetical protein